METIFEKNDEFIIGSEYKSFTPTSILNLNATIKRTTFSIVDADCFLNLKRAQYKIKGKLVQENGSDYPASSNVKLCDNFPAYLWKDMKVKLFNKEIEEVDNLGIASTAKGTFSYAVDGSGNTINSGYESRFGVGKFQAIGNLSQLCSGFFKMRHPIFKAGIVIEFIRNSDDDAIVIKNNTDNTTPVNGKIIIEEFLIKIPVVQYDEISKIQIVDDLHKLSQNNLYKLNFKSWQCMEFPVPVGRTFIKDLTSLNRNPHSPIFAFILFQTDKKDDQSKNPSAFDHCNVRNVQIEIHSKKYPNEDLNLDFKNEDYCEAYDMLSTYRERFIKSHEEVPLIYPDIKSFKETRTIFAIDLTRQPQMITESKNNIILRVEFNDIVPANTMCYVLLVSNTEIIYDINRNIIKDNI